MSASYQLEQQGGCREWLQVILVDVNVDVRHGKLMLQCDALGPASSYARRILIREQILRNNNVDYALAN